MKTLFFLLLPLTAIFFFGSFVSVKKNVIYTGSPAINNSLKAMPNIEETDVQPVDGGGNIIYLTCIPKSSKDKTTGLLSVFFKVKNKEGKALKVEKMGAGVC